LKLLRYTVSGRVQRVYFREGAKAEAQRLSVSGWVKNMTDGTVQGEAIGEPSSLDAFTEWLRKGPELATVRDLQTTMEDVEEDKYNGVFEKKRNVQ